MKHIYAIAAIFSATLLCAQQGGPAMPYYSGVDFTQSGTALKNALTTKTVNKHVNELTYSQIWDALQNTDKDPANANNVLLLYGWENGSDSNLTNDRSRSKTNNGGSNGQWNREHTFAQSLGNPDLGQIGPGADAHHLRACDVQRNNNRGNLLFASGSGVASGAAGNGWYPGDEWKGDVARMVMYMYLHYGNQCLPTVIGIGNPVATDSNMLDLFLQWNADDPVSTYEDYRNTYLSNTGNSFSQGNRNPFIDNPYLATMIWGGPAAQNRWPNLGTGDFSWTSTVSVYPNPAHDKVNISSDANVDVIEVISVNGQLLKHIDQPVFTDNVYSIDNLPAGFYLIRMESGNQSVTKKLLVN